ncbi:type I DNA topoisomerase [Candidatus Parcubacteria bacterium]|nr:type I DNA topoisomerase [Candidatus Parcubacteria bacterium]
MNLVIVESPTKAKTIKHFLGRQYSVKSSYGHIRDLPQKSLGVDTENDFKPKYVVSKKVKPTVDELKAAAERAKTVILATDEDREGEAIAWHLTQALGLADSKLPPAPSPPAGRTGLRRAGKTQNSKLPDVQRIVFHEITRSAIEEALKNPRDINMQLVDAQQARRILDRLVGYKLSPFLWRKVASGLSAGRVQSVAVRLVVEREREIEKFQKQEYWSVEATLRKENAPPKEAFVASLTKQDGNTLDKFALPNADAAQAVAVDLVGARWQVAEVERKEVRRTPPPPFTTSTLQQAASSRLHISARETMRLAQQLYEGIRLGDDGEVGLITYMRTDSTNLSQEFLGAARATIDRRFGHAYELPQPRRYRTKSKNAQEAHEAIRPTDPNRDPDAIKQYLAPRQYRLYQLIWQRALATQMAAAVFDATALEAEARGKAHAWIFRASGSVLMFDGFLKIWPLSSKDVLLPPLAKDDPLTTDDISPQQHFTAPPPRYSEATLVKALEEHGIGRPSTYAPTISTIQDRGYVERDEQKQLRPTQIGMLVNDLLVEHFPKIVDIQFTAKMEDELDQIAEGKMPWVPVIREFYGPFKENLDEKYQTISKSKIAEHIQTFANGTGANGAPAEPQVCEKCGKSMVVKIGRFGPFLACSGFPECRNTKPLGKSLDVKCPKCEKGNLVIKRTKTKKTFYACDQYPNCDFALWDKPTGEKCPTCGSLLVEKRGKKIACSNKDCNYAKSQPNKTEEK